jgi:hypothetical protein
MKRKRNINTAFLLLLRRFGMLCKLPRQEKPKLRIARTVFPDVKMSSIEAEQHVWIQSKLKSRTNCKFDSVTRTCPCGVKSIEAFAVKCNTTK